MDFPSTKKPPVPVKTLIASTGVGKSRTFRTTAVKVLNRTKYDDCVVIAVDRHDLGAEQLGMFYREHPNTALIARVWRGRGADDPEQPGMLMCWRNDEAEEAENHISALVSSHGFSVEWSLCHQQDPETGEDIYCEFHDRCGFQRQKLPANLWFCAHRVSRMRCQRFLVVCWRYLLMKTHWMVFSLASRSSTKWRSMP